MEKNNKTQRDAFWDRIYEIAKINRDIIIISADMGAPALDKIRRELPSQFINVGIAEQNAITLAAGLTMTGKKVFAYAIAPFITLRCLEQIRVECSIMNLPITIVGVGGGFGYEDSGPTHHIIEDIAILRSMPNIMINNITDIVMARAFADISCSLRQPNYIRLDRQVLPIIYTEENNFDKGLSVIRKGKDFYIISTGCMTSIAKDISEELSKEQKNIGLIDLYTLPINENELIETIKEAKKVITIEEHFLPGGFGSAICEVLMDNNINISVKRIGLSPKIGYSYVYGGRDEIRKHYGLDKASMIKQIKGFLNEY